MQRTVSYAIQKAKADLIPNGPDTSDWGKVNQTLTCSIIYFFLKKLMMRTKEMLRTLCMGFQLPVDLLSHSWPVASFSGCLSSCGSDLFFVSRLLALLPNFYTSVFASSRLCLINVLNLNVDRV